MLLNLKSTSLREVRKEPRRQRAVKPQVWKQREEFQLPLQELQLTLVALTPKT